MYYFNILNQQSSKMTIKHLVLSGGGPSLVQTLGTIQELETQKYFQRENIHSIYGTSAGALVGAIYCFGFDWETIDDYIIKRPWHEVFTIKIQNIFDTYTKKGIFDLKTVEKCFKPLLNAKDLDLNITLKQFYEYSKIELHLFSFEINQFEIVDISYKTHPELSFLTAIQMTCAIPVLVTPVCIDNQCFIDGGLESNYPLKYCLQTYPKEEEILGIRNCYKEREVSVINAESTLLDFIMSFLFHLLFSINTTTKQPKIPLEIICNTRYMSIEYFKNALSCEETRKEIYQNGIRIAQDFLSKKNEEK